MITFLIVEDLELKYKNIKHALETFGVNDKCIESADTINNALSMLKERTFDFVILDMMLPMSKEEPKVIKNGGTEILDALQHSLRMKTAKYNEPARILVMTESSSLINKYQADFQRCKVFAIHYQVNSNDWKYEIETEYKRLSAQQNAQLNKFSDERVVISIHGIRTFGEWQTKLGVAIKESLNENRAPQVKTIEYKYNFFPLISFLSSKKKDAEITRFAQKLLHIARTHPRAKISIVGHSFGTYLIFHGLKEVTQKLDLDYLILSGSVLQPNEKIEELYEKHNLTKILNECSTLDLPLLAGRFFTNTYSTAGMYGLTSLDSEVINRYTAGGHSSFFSSTILAEWSAFLLSGEIKFKDERKGGTVQEIIATLTNHRRYLYITFTVLVSLMLASGFYLM